jgi:aminoglycoside phosphotransferase (APT) family kinase protein
MATDENRGSGPVAERHRFEIGALEAYLREHVEGFAGPLTVEQFRGGQSNPTFRLSTPRQRYVMRAKPGPAAKLLPSAHAIEREFRVQRALAGTEVPVARMHCLCEDEAVIGRAFYVMDLVEGRVFWQQDLPGATNAERSAVYDEMNRVIAALHEVDHAAVGLEGFGRIGHYLERQIARWSKQYLASETEPIPEMNRLIDWLPAHIPPGDETTIVHGDYRLDNMIFAPDALKVAAVLDWELSTLGHPLADFAYHAMSYHIPGAQFRGIAGIDHAALGIPTEREYIARYCERTGRDGIAHYEFYLAYNAFRLAAILQGIMKRAVDGTAASTEAIETGRRARPLAEIAWSLAEKAGARA